MANPETLERIALTKKLMSDLIDSNFRQIHLTLTHYCYQSDEVQKLMFDVGGLCAETLLKFNKNFAHRSSEGIGPIAENPT